MAPNSVFLERLDSEDVADARPKGFDDDFDALYRRFYPRLVSMCRRRAGNDALAEDVAQETLIRALIHRDAFERGRPAWPWLKTIATNLIVDHYRKQVRESALPVENGDIAEDAPSLEETDLLRRAIQELPRRQRAAVALRYLNDWDAQDAASFMGVTRPAYEQLLFRARRRLKAEYRRLSQEVSVGIATGTAALRGWVRRAGDKARAAGGSNPGVVDLTSLTGAQLASGALALIMTLGVQPVTARHTPRATPVAARAALSVKTPLGGHQRAAAARLQRSSPGGPNAPIAAPAGRAAAGSGHGAERALVDQFTNDGVQQPEDVHITSVTLAGSGTGVDYAAGRAGCPSGLCPAVLFESRDGGATWSRLAAEGFDGESLLVPSDAGVDAPIFAMGRLGLQVSRDGGATFTAAAPGGVTYATGTAAISPAFANGDPTILIGAQTLLRYRDDLGIVEPASQTTGSGPLQPAFAPQYPADDRVMVGGLMFNPQLGRMTAAVQTCTGSVCTHTHVGELSLDVYVRPAPDFGQSGSLFAFTERAAFRSTDGGASFDELPSPWARGTLADVAVGTGRVFAAARSQDGGLYVSNDGGTSWAKLADELFAGGATKITVAGERVMVALDGTGFACSTDGGTTWAARCGPRV